MSAQQPTREEIEAAKKEALDALHSSAELQQKLNRYGGRGEVMRLPIYLDPKSVEALLAALASAERAAQLLDELLKEEAVSFRMVTDYGKVSREWPCDREGLRSMLDSVKAQAAQRKDGAS